jgi:hypothetical protein
MSWCPEIYRGLFILPAGKDEVGISPCCIAYDDHKETNDKFDYNNNSYLQNIRTENINSIKSPGCRHCWYIENNNGHSKRHGSIEFFDNITPNDTTVELNVLEYHVNWSCNLACIMCGPQDSSRWAKELNVKDISQLLHTSQNKILDNLDTSKLKRVHFNGGEPLLTNDHVKFLKRLPTLNECKVTYNTNGTVLPNKQTLEIWQRAKMVRLFFSIDATEESFEYIRWPGKWETIEKNIQWFLKNSPSNVMFGLNVTVGAYNLLEINKVWDWFTATIPTNRDGDTSDFSWQVAYGFEYNYLNDQIKQDALDKLRLYPDLQSLYNSIQINSSTSNKWIKQLDIIDKRRGTNWKQSLEIGKYFK